MARQLIRYLLEGRGNNPTFLDYGHGGHFMDPTTEEFVGVSVDQDKRRLPASVFKLTRAQLKNRLTTLGYDKNEDGSDMTNAELDTFIQEWLDGRGLGGLP
jgi:hypothetical protein